MDIIWTYDTTAGLGVEIEYFMEVWHEGDEATDEDDLFRSFVESLENN